MRDLHLNEKPFYLSGEQIEKIENTVSSMSDGEKAGQLFCVLGTACSDEELRDLVENWHIGGVLFRPGKTDEIKKRYDAADAMAKIPLLRAANLEEGGAGIVTDGTYFGSCMQLAASDDPECVKDAAKACALEGRRVGTNWTFSPVADIDFNFRNPITNVRTFGSDPEKVLECVKIFAETIQKYGIAAACKHYPGDGVDYRDQHLHPTYNALSADEWFATYGRIYKTLIDGGLMTVMAGHIVAPNVIKAVNPKASKEEMLPGSQSKEMLTGVLRERFGFNGLIITDATIMGGYTMTMPRDKAIPKSLMAGCDMFCFGTDMREDMTYVLKGLEDGLLTRERLDEAVTRVLALKAALSKGYPVPDIDPKAAALRCADEAVTLVKNNEGIIPVRPKEYPDIRLITLGNDSTYDGSMGQIAEDYLIENGFNVERYRPLEDDLHGTACLPKGRLTLILANLETASNQTSVRISWCEKHAIENPRFINEEPTVFISFANPYHLQDVPRVRTYINAYTATKATIEAALKKLLGRSPFKGKSPVDPFCGLEDTRL